MSSANQVATPSLAAGIVASVAGALKAGVATSASAAVTFLTGLGIGLLGQEAQDFDNFIDNIVESVEAGGTWAASYETAVAKLIAAEKSQLMADAMSAVAELSGLIDKINGVIQAAL